MSELLSWKRARWAFICAIFPGRPCVEVVWKGVEDEFHGQNLEKEILSNVRPWFVHCYISSYSVDTWLFYLCFILCKFVSKLKFQYLGIWNTKYFSAGYESIWQVIRCPSIKVMNEFISHPHGMAFLRCLVSGTISMTCDQKQSREGPMGYPVHNVLFMMVAPHLWMCHCFSAFSCHDKGRNQ